MEILWSTTSFTQAACVTTFVLLFLAVALLTRALLRRRQAESKLQEANRRFELVLNSLDAMVHAVDLETRQILFVNEYVRRKHGNVVGLECWKAFHLNRTGPCSSCNASMLKQSNGSSSGVRVWEILNEKDQRWYECRDQAIPWENGRMVRLQIATDITERKLALEALRESEEKYRSLVENSPDAIIRFDRSNRLLFVSPSASRILPFGLEGAVGKPIDEMILPVALCDSWRTGMERVLKAKSGFEAEVRLMEEKDPLTVELHLFPELDQAGDVKSVLSVGRDVTREKKIEAQLLHAQKMEAIGTLAGGIAHDFNNLLQAIQGYSEILLLGKAADDPGRDELEQIRQAAVRGSELIRRLLTFSCRIESNLQPLDLNGTLENLGRMLERTIPKTIRIEMRLSADLRYVNADEVQIEQAILNLSLNARDAMPEGGRIYMETDNAVVDYEYPSVPSMPAGEYVRITVTDTGYGMDRATREHIFEPFFTTKGVGKGTGLGLAMVYGIVKSHCGHIFCYSEIGRGTTFKIYLPAIAGMAEHPIELRSEELIGGTERILLIDDEEVVLSLGAKILSSHGYIVITASNGKEALEVFRREHTSIDLVILDLIMPVMDGYQCLIELLAIDPKVKVIIASGYPASGSSEEVMLPGARAFIDKPYEIRLMLDITRKVLDG